MSLTVNKFHRVFPESQMLKQNSYLVLATSLDIWNLLQHSPLQDKNKGSTSLQQTSLFSTDPGYGNPCSTAGQPGHSLSLISIQPQGEQNATKENGVSQMKKKNPLPLKENKSRYCKSIRFKDESHSKKKKDFQIYHL